MTKEKNANFRMTVLQVANKAHEDSRANNLVNIRTMLPILSFGQKIFKKNLKILDK